MGGRASTKIKEDQMLARQSVEAFSRCSSPQHQQQTVERIVRTTINNSNDRT